MKQLGAGSFGAVFAVTKKDEIDKNGNPKIYAMKILDKSNVI